MLNNSFISFPFYNDSLFAVTILSLQSDSTVHIKQNLNPLVFSNSIYSQTVTNLLEALRAFKFFVFVTSTVNLEGARSLFNVPIIRGSLKIFASS